MVRRRADAGPDGGADDDRAVHLPAEHVVDLGRLVEQLVAGDGQEVDEQDLDHGAQPRRGRADRVADDGRLGDGGIEHPRGPELLVDRPRHAETATELAHVLAGDVDVGIAAHLQGEGFRDGLHVVEGPHARPPAYTSLVSSDLSGKGLCLPYSMAASISASACSWMASSSASVASPRAEQDLANAGIGIALEPGLVLGRVAVLGAFADEMAPVPPGLGLDEGGPPAGSRPLDGLGGHLAHGEHVVAINHHSGEAVGSGTIGQVLQLRVVGLRVRHAVVVVLADVDGGQFPDGGEVEGLVEGAPVGGAVAEEGDRDLLLPPVFDGERRAGADVDRRPHDPVGPQHPVGHVGDVHGAALAVAVAVDAPVELGEHALRVAAPGQQVAVAAVAGDDVVVVVRTAMTPAAMASSPLYRCRKPGHPSLEERLVGVLLERPDADHAAVEARSSLPTGAASSVMAPPRAARPPDVDSALGYRLVRPRVRRVVPRRRHPLPH